MRWIIISSQLLTWWKQLSALWLKSLTVNICSIRKTEFAIYSIVNICRLVGAISELRQHNKAPLHQFGRMWCFMCDAWGSHDTINEWLTESLLRRLNQKRRNILSIDALIRSLTPVNLTCIRFACCALCVSVCCLDRMACCCCWCSCRFFSFSLYNSLTNYCTKSATHTHFHAFYRIRLKLRPFQLSLWECGS